MRPLRAAAAYAARAGLAAYVFRPQDGRNLSYVSAAPLGLR